MDRCVTGSLTEPGANQNNLLKETTNGKYCKTNVCQSENQLLAWFGLRGEVG